MFESEFDKFSIMFEPGTESSNMFAIGGNVKLRSYNTSTKYEPLDVIYEAQQEVRNLWVLVKTKIKTRNCMCIYSTFFFLLKLILMKNIFFSLKKNNFCFFAYPWRERMNFKFDCILVYYVFPFMELKNPKRHRKSFLLHFVLILIWCYIALYSQNLFYICSKWTWVNKVEKKIIPIGIH